MIATSRNEHWQIMRQNNKKWEVAKTQRIFKKNEGFNCNFNSNYLGKRLANLSDISDSIVKIITRSSRHSQNLLLSKHKTAQLNEY